MLPRLSICRPARRRLFMDPRSDHGESRRAAEACQGSRRSSKGLPTTPHRALFARPGAADPEPGRHEQTVAARPQDGTLGDVGAGSAIRLDDRWSRVPKGVPGD